MAVLRTRLKNGLLAERGKSMSGVGSVPQKCSQKPPIRSKITILIPKGALVMAFYHQANNDMQDPI